MRVPSRERGAALLTVLLLVSVMAALAAGAPVRVRLFTALAAETGPAQGAVSMVGEASLSDLRTRPDFSVSMRAPSGCSAIIRPDWLRCAA